MEQTLLTNGLIVETAETTNEDGRCLEVTVYRDTTYEENQVARAVIPKLTKKQFDNSSGPWLMAQFIKHCDLFQVKE